MCFEVIIGIEIHCELKTKTKMFSSSKVDANAEANTCVNEIDLAHPGTLPTINKEAVQLAIKACSATNCSIDRLLKFDRKNYYYSDLPKGFQITQQFFPIGSNGFVKIGKENKKIRINRIHLEEDTAKQYHLEETLIDYNRAGVALIEIVSEADIRNAQEACEYVETIRSMMYYLNVSDVKMEEGSLRCDVNISLRPFGYDGYGPKVEIKNLNSISNVAKAIEYEVKRQTKQILNNEEIIQETRRYDETEKVTKSMRKKEGSVDYKYFPEPNLVPTLIDENWMNEVIQNMEELPNQRKNRYMNQCLLSEYDSSLLIANKDLADLFDDVCQYSNEFKLITNWIMGEYSSYINKTKEHKLDSKQFAILINMIASKEISSKQAKEIFEEIMQGKQTKQVIEEKGMQQISDSSKVQELINQVLDQNQQSIDDYNNGKDRALKYLVGQIMKQSKGQVNPQMANDLLVEALKNRS